jgi:hypothetical protein
MVPNNSTKLAAASPASAVKRFILPRAGSGDKAAAKQLINKKLA